MKNKELEEKTKSTIKNLLIYMLDKMNPVEAEPGDFKGEAIEDAIEYGEKKQRWRETLINERAVKEQVPIFVDKIYEAIEVYGAIKVSQYVKDNIS